MVWYGVVCVRLDLTDESIDRQTNNLLNDWSIDRVINQSTLQTDQVRK